MRIDGPQITGSFSLNGDGVQDLDVFATTSSLNTYTSSTDTMMGHVLTATHSLNTFTSSAGSRMVSIESKTGSYATTGSNTFVGLQTIQGSIVPGAHATYDLGSAGYNFRHLYLSSASLYIDGTKVLGSTTQELQITTDNGQSFKILEAGSDTITLQSNDGNITLATSGGGDVILDPTTGIIALKGTTQVYSGNKIRSSDGNNIVFGDGLTVSGSVTITGFIEAQELRTTYISSSILYRSGSTKFGDELTDTHTFTGSLLVSGSISVPGSGLISGSSQILNGSGVWSGSAQLPSGVVSGSAQITLSSTTGFGSYLNQAVLSSSSPTFSTLIISGSSNTFQLQTTRTSGTPHIKLNNTDDSGNYAVFYADYNSFKLANRGTDNLDDYVWLYGNGSNGHVGIGTSGPSARLTVSDTSTYQTAIFNASSTGGYITFQENGSVTANLQWGLTEDGGANGNYFLLTNNEAGGYLGLQTKTTGGTLNQRAFIINPQGYIGINKSSPTYRLDVYDATPFGGILTNIESGNASAWFRLRSTGSTWQMGATANGLEFYNETNTATRVTIAPNGKVGIGETSPDNSYQGLTIKGTDPSVRIKTTSASGWTWIEYVNSSGVNTWSSGVNHTSSYFAIKAGAGLDSPTFVVTSGGSVGVGVSNSPLTTFTVKSTNDNGYALTRPSDATALHWRLSTTETGGDAYTVRYNTFNNNMLFTTYTAGGTGGVIIFRTSASGGSGSEIERLRISAGGDISGGNNPNVTFTFQNDGTYAGGSGAGTTFRIRYGEQIIARIANTGTGQRDAIFQLYDENTVKINIAANTSRGGVTYFNNGGNFAIGTDTAGSRLTVSGANTGGTPLVDLTASGTGTFQRGVRLLNGGMNSGDHIMYAVGRSDNSRNMGQTYFYFAGDNSTSNRLSFGLHSVDDVMHVQGNATVTIGGTGQYSASKLAVEGALKVNRTIYNWFQAGTNDWDGYAFLHLKTNMWAGGSPNGNIHYTMSLFHAKLYSYSSPYVKEGNMGFHNWSGSHYSIATSGNVWTTAYTSSDGYTVLVISLGSGSYMGVTIDWHQAYGYPFQDKSVTTYARSNSSTGVY